MLLFTLRLTVLGASCDISSESAELYQRVEVRILLFGPDRQQPGESPVIFPVNGGTAATENLILHLPPPLYNHRVPPMLVNSK
jgi:hypothetical protein